MKLLPMLAALSALMLLNACASDCFDASVHGQSYRAYFSAQPVNPDAPADTAPAVTLPGRVANDIYQNRYLPEMTEKKSEKDEKLETQFGK